MATGDDSQETDDRLPSGEWNGFFIQPNSRKRHAMTLFLQFAENRITGEGDDSIGKFAIVGAYDTSTGTCTWSKQYVGQHAVQYSGECRQKGIIGQWRIDGQPEFWSGPYFVWPKALGDLQPNFERAFLEYELKPVVDVPQASADA